jgi:hypothetical protein
MDLCDEYPECTAFEVDDGDPSVLDPTQSGFLHEGPKGAFAAFRVFPNAECRLYRSQETVPSDDPRQNCYVNLDRQDEDRVLFHMRDRAVEAVDEGGGTETRRRVFRDFLVDPEHGCERGRGSAFAWCPSKATCIRSWEEPCPVCGEGSGADGGGAPMEGGGRACTDGFSLTEADCARAHCAFNDGPAYARGRSGRLVFTREGCLELCGLPGDDDVIINEAAVRARRRVSRDAERWGEVVGLNRCKWYDAGEATMVDVCDPNGCAPDFRYCYLESSCMRTDLLETWAHTDAQVRGPLGCNNGTRRTNEPGFDDTEWYPADAQRLGPIYTVEDDAQMIGFTNESEFDEEYYKSEHR